MTPRSCAGEKKCRTSKRVAFQNLGGGASLIGCWVLCITEYSVQQSTKAVTTNLAKVVWSTGETRGFGFWKWHL